MRRLIAALLLAGSGVAGALLSQGPESATGQISGRVVLVGGGAVAGATVILTGPPPVLRRAFTTDDHGRFGFPGLGDGLYAIEAGHSRTSTAVAERLRLRGGEALRLRLEVEAGSPGKLTIAAQPLLDVTTPNRPRSQDGPQLLLLPADRTHDASLRQLAGIEDDRQAVTGLDGGTAGLAVEGLSVAEVALFIDGFDATSTRTGLPTQRLPLELVDTQQVVGPTRSADSRSSAGASVVVLTHRPGPEWRGGATLLYSGDHLRSTARISPASLPTIDSPLGEVFDVGLWGAGPLDEKHGWLALGTVPRLGEGRDIDLVRVPASGRLNLRPAANVNLRLAASSTTLQGPVPGSSADAFQGDQIRLREDSDTFVAGILLDWIAAPGLAMQGSLERFSLRREARTIADGEPFDEEQQRRAAGLHLDLALPVIRLHALSLGALWSEPRTEVATPTHFSSPGVVTGEELSVFVRDTVQIWERISLDLGLRSESTRARRHGSPQDIDFGLLDTLAPRLGLAWDVRGDGQWKTYGQAAWTSPPMRHQLPLEAFTVDRRAIVDPELEAPRAFAAAVGVDHLLLPTVRVGAELSLHTQLEGISLMPIAANEHELVTIQEAVVNPGSGLGALPYGPDLPHHPGLKRDFKALTITAAALFPRWSGRFSYVWSDLDGTWNGLANPDDPTAPVSPHTGDTCSTLEGCYNAAGTPARGPLAVERPHSLKLSGHLRLREGLTLAGLFQLESGTPFARQVPVVTVAGESAVLTRLFHPDGRASGGRLPMRAQIDLRLQYEVLSRPRGQRLVLFADLRNAFDDQSVQVRWPVAYMEAIEVDRAAFFAGFDVDALAGAQGIEADPRLGEGLRFAPPRRLQLGLRWEW